MAKKVLVAKSGPTQALVLISLEKPTDETRSRLQQVAGVSGVKKAWRSFGTRKRIHPISAFFQVRAKDHDALVKTLAHIHANFSHVEAYEFSSDGP